MMAISHAGHDHPNTTAARTACRKAMAKAGDAGLARVADTITGALTGKPAKIVKVEPKGRGRRRVPAALAEDGMRNATTPRVADRRLKVSGTKIASVADLADVPAILADTIREAWKQDLTVQAGHPFNELERRVVITAPLAEVALVWSADGLRVGYFVRNHNSSVTFRVDTATDAFHAAFNAERWTAQGNLVQVTGKRKR